MESDNYLSYLLLQVIYYNPITVVATFCIALFLLCFTTLLSIAEIAISSLSKNELNEVAEIQFKESRIISRLSDCPKLMHVSCRIMYVFIIIAVTVLCCYGMSILTPDIKPYITYPATFIGVSLLWLIFYGILPKIAQDNKASMARLTATLLNSVVKLNIPFIRIANIKVERIDECNNIKAQVPLVNEVPNDIYEEKEMLEEIIHFYNKTANEIMTPRTDMEAINIKNDLEEVTNVIVESGYSRIPVYEENEDDIKGVLYVKDIIPAITKSKNFAWQSLIRKPYFIPETKKIDDLLGEFRAKKIHMAIVVDEFGGTSGIVTMEDILEEIVGDISDEYDDDEMSFVALPDGGFIFEGKTQLNDFFRETGIMPKDFGEYKEEAETLTGLLLAIKGSLPYRREIIEYKNYKFRVLEADDRRVLKVKLSILPKEDDEKKKNSDA